MNIYVAGRTSAYKRVREVQSHLRNLGHQITYDWTGAAPDEVWEGGAGMDTEVFDDDYLRQQAEADRGGVLDADCVVLVAGKNMVGSYIEVGMALATNTPVIILGEVERESVFNKLAEVYRCADVSDLGHTLTDVENDY